MFHISYLTMICAIIRQQGLYQVCERSLLSMKNAKDAYSNQRAIFACVFKEKKEH